MGTTLLFCWIQILDFLAFHPLFGPWAIIIGECLLDVGKFVVVLSLFVFGYAMLGSSMNQPFGLPTDFVDDPELNPDNLTQAELFDKKSTEEQNHPFYMFEVHFFALFGITSHEDVMDSKYIQGRQTATKYKHNYSLSIGRLDGVLVQVGVCFLLDSVNYCPDQFADCHDE